MGRVLVTPVNTPRKIQREFQISQGPIDLFLKHTMPITLALGKWRQEVEEIKTILSAS